MTDQVIYFEVSGKLKDEVILIKTRRAEMSKAALKFAKEFGASGYQFVNGMCARLVGFVFDDEPDPELFRKFYDRSERKHTDWYVPNAKTKKGKAIRERMRDYEFPTTMSLGQKINIGGFFVSPGVEYFTKGRGKTKTVRAVLAVPAGYKPTGEFKKDMKRISDVDLEALRKPKSRKKK